MYPFTEVMLLVSFLCLLECLIIEEPTPKVFEDCIKNTPTNNATRKSQVINRKHCLNVIHEKKETDYFSQADIDFVNDILEQMMNEKGRIKRQVAQPVVRREVRSLTEAEWNTFVNAIQTLKREGTYDRLAAVHRGAFNLQSAHRGPNFFGWHRIYLLIFEWSLQRVSPGLALPYWDSTIDFDTTNPTRSVLWTSRFFGNGNGVVTSGPFANWVTGNNQRLMRNIGSGGTLMTKAGVDLILSRSSHSEIIDANNVMYYFEGYHDGPHVWVDGNMRVLETAAEDPVFFLHHCFVDYVWELFREQLRSRGISPETDYPNVMGPHSPNRQMAAFNRLTNLHGYLDLWTNRYYSYFPSPSCSTTEPSCTSDFLTCDVTRERCVTTEGEFPFSAILGPSFGEDGTPTIVAVRAPPSDERLASAQGLLLPDGEPFHSALIDERTRNDPLPQVFTRFSPSNWMGFRKKRSTSLQNDTLVKHVLQNKNFDLSKDIIYVPISIISYHPSAQNFESIVIQNGEIRNHIIESKTDEIQNIPKTGSTVAFVQSDGVSYRGRFKDVAVTDIEHMVSSTFSYIALQNPQNESVSAIITVYDNFDRICKPMCLLHRDTDTTYKACSGTIKVTPETPKMYSLTYEESVTSVWNITDPFNPSISDKQVFMKFICKDLK